MKTRTTTCKTRHTARAVSLRGCRPGKPVSPEKTSRRHKSSEIIPAPAPVLPAKAVAPVVETAVAPTPAETGPRGSLELYLREIGQVALLTPKDEIRLARQIKRGNAAARELMIKANLRLVVKIARDYEGIGLPLLDLINEGNMGLMKAVERFNPAKGAKLSTYAAWWIKQSIKRALANQSKTIRLPVHVVDKIANIRRTETRLQETLGRVPTNEEVGEELGVPARRVAHYRQASQQMSSLDAPLGDDETSRVADIVADPAAQSPYDQLREKTETSMLHTFLGGLDAREQAVLRQRFGLDSGEEQTLEEVGVKFGVTRERIRQIQNEAIQKLRRRMEKFDSAKQLILTA